MFGLTTVEGGRFLPEIEPIAPSSYLQEALSEGLLGMLVWMVQQG